MNSSRLLVKTKYLIHPSLSYETFGLTILEAMSVGTPVIGFEIGTRKEFIVDGFNGFLTSSNNLRQTIIKAQNYSNYSKMSENCIKTADKYSQERIITKQVDLYKKIIDNEWLKNT